MTMRRLKNEEYFRFLNKVIKGEIQVLVDETEEKPCGTTLVDVKRTQTFENDSRIYNVITTVTKGVKGVWYGERYTYYIEEVSKEQYQEMLQAEIQNIDSKMC